MSDMLNMSIKMTMYVQTPAGVSQLYERVARVIPPIATSGFRVNARARRTPSRPTTGSGLSLLEVENTGPMAR